jgi:AraC-like DNA-binding protein
MLMNTTMIVFTGGHNRCTPTNWLGSGEHSHCAKVYAPIRGEATLAVDGQSSTLEAGRLYLVPPHHRLTYRTNKEFVVDWLHFKPESVVLDLQLSKLESVFPLPLALARHWQPVTSQLGDYFNRHSPALACRVHAMLLDVVGAALEIMPTTTAASPDERLLPALRYMDDHVNATPSLADIAGTVHLSPEHFHRLFRRQFGATPFDYLLQRRLARAHRLLTEGVLSVKEVAIACGYDDPYYFSRVFRRQYHCTPRQIRLGQIPARP